MNYNKNCSEDKNPFSILLRDEFSVSKILSRDSSRGQSSRIYYRSTANEGVPFKWEMQPGTPKNPPREEVVPPPTPPPAVQSMGIPRPNILDHQKKPRPSILRFWFWKRSKKRQNDHWKVQRGYGGGNSSNGDGDSDREFIGWVHGDSRSSSFSFSSSSNGFAGEQPARLKNDVPPWNMSAVLFCIPRKV